MQKGIVGIRVALFVSVCAFVVSASAHMGHQVYTFETHRLVAQTLSSDTDSTNELDSTSSTYFEEDITSTFTETSDTTTQEFETSFFESYESTDTEDIANTETQITGSQSTIHCPFTAEYGDVLLNFQESHSVTARVLSGTYSISLASYHVPEQTLGNVLNESWHLVLLDKTGTVVFTSDAIRDIRNDESLAMERVHTETTIMRNAYHAQARINDRVDMTQQFTPVCALLRPIITRTDVSGDTTQDAQSMETFLEERDASVDTFRSEMEQNSLPTEQSFENTEAFETEVQVTPDTQYSYVRIEGDGISGSVTGSASTYASHDSANTKTFSYVSVTRADITERVPGDLFLELGALSQKKRAELLHTAFTEARGTGTSQLLTPIFERTVAVENTINDTEIRALESEMVFETFRFTHRAELGDTVDSDGDGVIDYDEVYVYKTNPFNPFTSGGPLTDGERLLLGLDPTKNTFDVVPVESPVETETASVNMFAIESISFAQKEERIIYADREGAPKEHAPIQIIGSAPPFSFVTLYVYSNPIVVTVRADGEGKFVYTLDETIDDGSHEIHVATVNTSGKILAKSEPIPFVKTAQAIEYTPAMVSEVTGPVDEAMQTGIALALLLFLVFSIGVVVFIGYKKTEHTATAIVHSDEKHD